jgi:hypothetical protein
MIRYVRQLKGKFAGEEEEPGIHFEAEAPGR